MVDSHPDLWYWACAHRAPGEDLRGEWNQLFTWIQPTYTLHKTEGPFFKLGVLSSAECGLWASGILIKEFIGNAVWVFTSANQSESAFQQAPQMVCPYTTGREVLVYPYYMPYCSKFRRKNRVARKVWNAVSAQKRKACCCRRHVTGEYVGSRSWAQCGVLGLWLVRMACSTIAQ